MIALADGLPLVQLDDGQVVAFEREWLLRALVQAAGKAGYQKWWLAEHVAESVMAYLVLQFEENVVSVPELANSVQSVLQVIGYAEVAPHFTLGLPGVRLSLMDLAREAGSGYELAFFEFLGRRLQQLLNSGTTHFELIGLSPCVKQLRSRKTWSRDCDALQADIVSFVRMQTLSAQLEREVSVRVR